MEKIGNSAVILAAGTLYGTIGNLNKHGWIAPVGGSEQRKVYMITAEGNAILKMEQNRLLHILSLCEGSELNEEI
ncbi:helix-turn-helix transcriptional regulator [Bacillus wiedmannii]|uniref:helix-turn-helix transcriptional regulator n=1 Tax=Bacillus wiedmannii TaxID=1890302 RepID=UPI00211D390E|nr:helix-turn-helix transcriptional regulator [Bacillus wiedmannii]